MKTLQYIQEHLKAPKNQYNSFGKYKYRSCEDILEAVKPLLAEKNAVLLLSDKPIEVGGKVYIEATATLKSDGEEVVVTASAREADTKKGMDDAQITGSASSYARKYALNGLFCIDDSKDSDNPESNEWKNEISKIEDIKALEVFWKANKGKGAEFDSYVSAHKKKLLGESTK